MKKQTNRLLSILLTLVMVLGMLPTTAFATENSHSEHSSYITHIEAVAGNCTTPGNIEFWYCSYYTCDKCYSDEAMTQEISPADVVIIPGAHSDACVGCEHGKSEKTFELFVPSEHPYYDEDEYTNNGLHILTPQLKGFTFLFVSEYNGTLYAMGNETLADGSRPAINLSEFVGEDGSITVDSDTVEFFTYKEIPYTYTFSPDNGYMTVLDGKIVVHGENLCDIDTSYDVFPQSIRFEQNTELIDYAADKGYLFGWALNSPLILFDDSGAEPKFTPTLMWPVDENGDYIEDENGVNIDNRAHNIMLYMERCEHPNMKHTEPAGATCTEDGAIEHWYCEDCKLYFANSEATEYIELPEGISDYEQYLTIYATGHEYGDDNYCDNCGEIWHPNAIRMEGEEIDPTCFEPGSGAYWFCEECGMYMDESKENEYREEAPAAKIPALGHAFNTDTGECDNCGLANPVYTKVTSLNDVNEEDLYIFVAKVGDKYFALGGLDESTPDEQGNVRCGNSGNAIEVVPYEDGSISLLNQNYVGTMKPSEFMFDVNPDQWNFTENGLTTVMPLLPNYCVYSFQSSSFENTGYMGVPRYANGVYGMWDASAWVIDFYTTEVTDDTYKYTDEFGSKTHAQQVADGNIGNNIAEGNLLLYKSSFYAVGGAMFTLRFREYPNQNTGVTEYYFICGEDWALEGSPGWDYVTDTTPTNDTQYAISLYRYDVPTVDTHTCDWGDWVDDKNDKTHSRTCQDETCGKTETEDHNWDKGTETKAPTCTEAGEMSYTCTKKTCGATKTESIDALDHDWSKWTDDGVDATTDTHTHTCQRNCGVAAESEPHSWGKWTPDGDANHKKTCADCSGERTDTHKWDDGVITTQPTEEAAGVKTYTCSECGHTKTEPVDKLEHVHNWTNWAPNNDGKTHSRSCRCNETQTAGHNFDDGEVTLAPTCGTNGKKVFTCTDCGAQKTEVIPATGDHKYVELEQTVDTDYVPATCEEAGQYTMRCTVCGDSYLVATAPLGHTWGEWETTTDAAPGVEGVATRCCSNDQSHVETRAIPALPAYCIHTCAACGGCTAADPCDGQKECDCTQEVVKPLTTAVVNDITIELPVNIPNSITTTAVEVPVTDNAGNPYVEYVITDASGYDVETIYDIGLVDTDTGSEYELPAGNSAEIRLFIGEKYAGGIDSGAMYLVHITDSGKVMYGLGHEPITAEVDANGHYTGHVIFTATGFSPFALVSFDYYGRTELAKMAGGEALVKAYDALVKGVETAVETIDLSACGLTEAQFTTAYYAYLRDHAEHFWVGGSYSFSLSQAEGKVVSVSPQYLMTGSALTAARAEFETAVDELLAGVKGSMSEYERELLIHDRLAARVSYVSDANAHNAYGALVEGKAVCEGYAEALQVLLHRAGIQSFLVTGYRTNPGSGSSESHMWNLVRIDDAYYYVDVTWDDQGEDIFHAYFNQTTAVMGEDHSFDGTDAENYIPLPTCGATAANYFVKTGKILEDGYTAQQVAACLSSRDGIYSGSVYCSDSGGSDGFSDWLTDNIQAVAAKLSIVGAYRISWRSLGRETILTIVPSGSAEPLAVTVISGGKNSVTVQVGTSWPLECVYLAAYDNRGRMLATKCISVDSGASASHTLSFSGTAHKVKAFMLQDGAFTPLFGLVSKIVC